MILIRPGNKSALAHKIRPLFPPHDIYIEPFFGAGGMFFNKPKVTHNFVNDMDSDVFNLYQVITEHKEAFEKAFYTMPIHSDLLNHWRTNKETEPIKKALRFVFLSNFTFLGAQTTINNGSRNPKAFFLKNLDRTANLLFDVFFSNFDFRKFIKSISFREDSEVQKAFIYADPPYLSTDCKNYENSLFKESDSLDLFEALENKKVKWAMSEFEHPFILQQAEQRGLSVHRIGERRNLRNRRMEILVTNYKQNKTFF